MVTFENNLRDIWKSTRDIMLGGNCIYSGIAKVVTAKVVTFFKLTNTRDEFFNLLVSIFPDSKISFI